VVGVVGDVDYGRDMVSFGNVPEAQVYVPYGHLPTSSLSVAVFANVPAADLAPALRAAFRRGAPGVPFSEVLTLEQAAFRERWASAFFSRLLGLYAAAATLIAAVGLYGLVSDSTARRRRELAVRLALGARPGMLVAMIVAEALRLGMAGVGLGLLAAAALGRWAAGMLQLVQVYDPAVFISVGVLLLAVTVLAATLPAWRAAALDPSLALRAE
jgi:putative ABC transport system permease protein